MAAALAAPDVDAIGVAVFVEGKEGLGR